MYRDAKQKYCFIELEEVLRTFKKLHKTRIKVFQNDIKALTAARLKINEGFKKNKDVTQNESIKEMIKFGEEIEKQLRTQVIQAYEVKPGVYEARISEETLKLDNVPYNDAAVPVEGIKRKKGTPCCQTTDDKSK